MTDDHFQSISAIAFKDDLYEKLGQAALHDPYIRRMLEAHRHGMNFELVLIQCVLALSESNKKLSEACNKMLREWPKPGNPLVDGSPR